MIFLTHFHFVTCLLHQSPKRLDVPLPLSCFDVWTVDLFDRSVGFVEFVIAIEMRAVERDHLEASLAYIQMLV